MEEAFVQQSPQSSGNKPENKQKGIKFKSLWATRETVNKIKKESSDNCKPYI